MIDFEPLPLAGAYLLHHRRVADDRGGFLRLMCGELLAANGLEGSFPQQNLSTCSQRGVLRGLHYQIPPVMEAKLLHCVRGSVFDVIVDVRKESPTFLRWHGVELSAEDAVSVYAPPCFAHGYQALEPDSAVVYHASSPYSPEHERQVRFDDPRVGVNWPVAEPILSEKDRSIPLLTDNFNGVVT